MSATNRASVAAAIGFLFSGAAALGQSFTFTGEGARVGRVTGLSADGRVATLEFGVWTRETGFHNFNLDPEFPDFPSASGISTDGHTVVGRYRTEPNRFSAYRWRGAGTFESLGRRPEYASAIAVDADEHGDTIVGRVHDPEFGTFAQAFRWTASRGIEMLGFALPDDYHSEALAVTRDGGTIVGYSLADTSQRAVYWDSSGVHVLQSLPGRPDDPADYAFAVSGDGRFMVGKSGTSDLTMWADGVPQDLWRISGWDGWALAVSDDGGVVGGTAVGSTAGFATVWTRARGAETLEAYLATQGVVMPNGWTLQSCTVISADGRTFGGVARHESGQQYGFVTTIPSPSGIVALCIGFVGVIHNRKRGGCFSRRGGVG